MTDQIHIRDLHLRTIIGISAEERRDRQDVLIDITLDADLRAAGQSDNIDDAVNYRTLTKRVIALVETAQFYLVEKLAAEIARLCLEDARVERARVSVEKPGALRFARTVGVTIERAREVTATTPGATNLAYLSLGSNIDPERNLPAAVNLLAAAGRLRAVSSVWETEPVGFVDQPNFLNAALILETVLSAADLRAQAITQVENALGRVRTANKNAPRTIDIDIILFNHDTLHVGTRHIPDPDVLQRPFVATPLAEIAPDYVHPATGETLHAIAQRLGTAHMLPRPDVILSVNQA